MIPLFFVALLLALVVLGGWQPLQERLRGPCVLDGEAEPTQARQFQALPDPDFVSAASMGSELTALSGLHGHHFALKGARPSRTQCCPAGTTFLDRIAAARDHARAATALEHTRQSGFMAPSRPGPGLTVRTHVYRPLFYATISAVDF